MTDSDLESRLQAAGESGQLPLEMDGRAFKVIVNQVADQLAKHLDSLAEQPAWSTTGGEQLARQVIEPMPWEGGTKIEELTRRVIDDLTSVSFNTASPGYMAFVPGGGIPLSAIADLIAATINRFVTVWVAAPALAQIENTVVRWFAEMIGYDQQSGGYLSSGGSLANWSALVTARRCRLSDDFQDGCIYVSDQAHHCIEKAAVLAGFPIANVRLIPTSADFRIQPSALRKQIDRDLDNDLQPFFLVGNAATTNTGAIDDLNALADLAAEYRLWFHVDAAYGGFFALTERGRRALAGIDRSDSVTLDPHKALFLPYGTGCLLVRRWHDLKHTHHVDGAYMPSMQENPEFLDISTISPELSRDFRGLRIWLPLKVVGASAFADQLNEKLDLTHWAHEQLRTIGNIEIVAAPQMTTIAFRYRPPGHQGAQLDELNRRFLAEINSSQRFYLTPTWLNGRFVIRICILSFRTHLQQVRVCLEQIRATAHAFDSDDL